MFLIFINDLPQSLSSKVRYFADDTILYFVQASADNCQALQSDFRLTEWGEKWLMSFNPSKCEVLTVTHKKKHILFRGKANQVLGFAKRNIKTVRHIASRQKHIKHLIVRPRLE